MSTLKNFRKAQLKKYSVSIKERQEQLETAVREIIDTIENYHGNAQFQFIEGFEAGPGEYLFPAHSGRFSKFQSWTERWMGAIEPLTIDLQGNGDPDGELPYFTQRFGHYIGVLCGAKFMGASRTQLESMARGLIHHQLGADAKKARR